jgi:hypothetical protein
VGDDEDVDQTLSLLTVSPRETQRKEVYQVLPRLPEARELLGLHAQIAAL